jgi:hypothetical protein
MWDRGEKARAIAAALGCNVGAVNVARARFGLKPRRPVAGRPSQPDEPAHKIDRVTFFTSRLMEFCTEKELVAQTGHESYERPLVVVKELVDNSIDACEEAEVAPVITVAIWSDQGGKRIVIEDNGPGIPPATVTGIIDYNVRASSKEAIISPTRGRQGNALKTVLPMAYVLGGRGRARLGSKRAASGTASCSASIKSGRNPSSKIYAPRHRSRLARALRSFGRRTRVSTQPRLRT